MQSVAALAGAAGYNAVTVFALCISLDTVYSLYHHPTSPPDARLIPSFLC
jgi:hypothetical protein